MGRPVDRGLVLGPLSFVLGPLSFVLCRGAARNSVPYGRSTGRGGEVAGLDPRNRKRDRGQDGEAAGYAAEERMGIFIGRRCALHLAWEGKRLS
jgi:hypothetical protein